MSNWRNKNQPEKNGEYRSKLEKTVADLLKRFNIPFEYESEKIDYRSRIRSGICGDCGCTKVYQRNTYLPDFRLGDGTIVEAKGILSASERAKFLAIREANPGVRIVFVFGSDNKLVKSNERRYSDWCKEHRFEFGIQALPASFVNEFKGA